MLPESESGGDFSLDLVTNGFNIYKQIGNTLKLKGEYDSYSQRVVLKSSILHRFHIGQFSL